MDRQTQEIWQAALKESQERLETTLKAMTPLERRVWEHVYLKLATFITEQRYATLELVLSAMDYLSASLKRQEELIAVTGASPNTGELLTLALGGTVDGDDDEKAPLRVN